MRLILRVRAQDGARKTIKTIPRAERSAEKGADTADVCDCPESGGANTSYSLHSDIWSLPVSANATTDIELPQLCLFGYISYRYMLFVDSNYHNIDRMLGLSISSASGACTRQTSRGTMFI